MGNPTVTMAVTRISAIQRPVLFVAYQTSSSVIMACVSTKPKSVTSEMTVGTLQMNYFVVRDPSLFMISGMKVGTLQINFSVVRDPSLFMTSGMTGDCGNGPFIIYYLQDDCGDSSDEQLCGNGPIIIYDLWDDCGDSFKSLYGKRLFIIYDCGDCVVMDPSLFMTSKMTVGTLQMNYCVVRDPSLFMISGMTVGTLQINFSLARDPSLFMTSGMTVGTVW